MNRSRFLLPLAFAILVPALAGCLGEPGIEERWTLLEIVDAQPTEGGAYAPGSPTPVEMNARITYRELLTGHLVADLRATNTITPADVALDADDPRAVALDVDRILMDSVSLGADAVAITGWDHLQQDVSFSFDGGLLAPTGADSSIASAGSVPVNATGLFLLLYFADDVEEVELDSGEEIEVIHPALSADFDILSTGIGLGP
ncbi:hypothetical protein K8I85_12960 [bacterium]|nr:hypothetical protein [bacterium]